MAAKKIKREEPVTATMVEAAFGLLPVKDEPKKRANAVSTYRYIGDSQIAFATVGMSGELILDLRQVTESNKAHAALWGFVQRITDAAAKSRNTETGASATPEEKHEAKRKLVDHYMSGSGEWSPARSGSVGETGGLTLRAVAAVQGLSVADMQERITKMAEKKGVTTRAILASLTTLPAVVKKMDELRPASGIDANGLLDELNSL